MQYKLDAKCKYFSICNLYLMHKFFKLIGRQVPALPCTTDKYKTCPNYIMIVKIFEGD
jgi:hypothetical protein